MPQASKAYLVKDLDTLHKQSKGLNAQITSIQGAREEGIGVDIIYARGEVWVRGFSLPLEEIFLDAGKPLQNA